MKKVYLKALAVSAVFFLLSSCEMRSTHADENYLEVIGEYEQQMPEAGYRLNLSYNGPIDKRDAFVAWADSLKQQVPGMVKTNESIYVNYMPGKMGQKVSKDMYQTSVTYQLTVQDSTLYNQVSEDLLKRNFPFSINIMGSFISPAQKTQLQQQMMDQALNNARTKLDFLAGKDREYEIVRIEELDNTSPYGPEYYDFNRRMMSRLKVKAKLD